MPDVREEGEGQEVAAGGLEHGRPTSGLVLICAIPRGWFVIASGGGGVPVMKDANGDYKGLEAVIDKDRAGEVMAVELGADTFMVLTDVENAIVNFGKPEAKPIGAISGADMKKFQAEGHFLAGSMGPKVEACQQFIVDGGARAIITSLDKAEDAIEGKTGTIITK